MKPIKIDVKLNFFKIFNKKRKTTTKDKIKEIFSKNDIVVFKDIEDPIKWQRELRDEYRQ